MGGPQEPVYEEHIPDGATPTPAEIETALAMAAELRSLMWRAAGILRTPNGLVAGTGRIETLCADAKALHRRFPTSETHISLRNMCLAGLGIMQSALANPKSTGGHQIRSDADAVWLSHGIETRYDGNYVAHSDRGWAWQL